MLLSTIASVFSAFLFAQSTLAALTPMGVVTNINAVATVSVRANSALSQLTTTSSPKEVGMIGQMLGTNLKTIIGELAGDVTAMQATPPFRDGVTPPIVEALRNFVYIHQALLATVIGKHSIFAQFGVTAPIAAVLRSLELVIDSFAFAMIDLIPTRQDEVKMGKSQLDISVGISITLYKEICIPSLFYPKSMPKCLAVGC